MRVRSVVRYFSLLGVILVLSVACAHKAAMTVPTPSPAAQPSVAPAPVPMQHKEVTEPFGTAPVNSAAMQQSAKAPGLETIHFAYDSYDLTAEDLADLRNNAAWLKTHPKDNILIAGNCDERGTIEYNLALGERRAQAAEKYLTDLGIDPSRIRIVSFGKERPIDPAHTETAWAKNRRDDFTKIVPGTSSSASSGS